MSISEIQNPSSFLSTLPPSTRITSINDFLVALQEFMSTSADLSKLQEWISSTKKALDPVVFSFANDLSQMLSTPPVLLHMENMEAILSNDFSGFVEYALSKAFGIYFRQCISEKNWTNYVLLLNLIQELPDSNPIRERNFEGFLRQFIQNIKCADFCAYYNQLTNIQMFKNCLYDFYCQEKPTLFQSYRGDPFHLEIILTACLRSPEKWFIFLEEIPSVSSSDLEYIFNVFLSKYNEIPDSFSLAKKLLQINFINHASLEFWLLRKLKENEYIQITPSQMLELLKICEIERRQKDPIESSLKANERTLDLYISFLGWDWIFDHLDTSDCEMDLSLVYKKIQIWNPSSVDYLPHYALGRPQPRKEILCALHLLTRTHSTPNESHELSTIKLYAKLWSWKDAISHFEILRPHISQQSLGNFIKEMITSIWNEKQEPMLPDLLEKIYQLIPNKQDRTNIALLLAPSNIATMSTSQLSVFFALQNQGFSRFLDFLEICIPYLSLETTPIETWESRAWDGIKTQNPYLLSFIQWFQDQEKKIQEENNEQLAKNLTELLKNTREHYRKSLQKNSRFVPIACLENIFLFRNTTLKSPLLENLSKIYLETNLRDCFEKMYHKAPKKLFSAIFFSPWIALVPQMESVFDSIPVRWHDESKQLPDFLQMLNELTSHEIPVETIQSLLIECLQPIKKTNGNLQTNLEEVHELTLQILSIIKTGYIRAVTGPTRQSIRDLHQISMINFFQLSPEYAQNFMETFGKFRDRSAIILYTEALQYEEPMLMSLWKKGLNDVLRKAFPESRYDIHATRHMETVFQTNPKLLENWKKTGLIPISFSSIFRKKILEQGHLWVKEEIPYLWQFLEGTIPIVTAHTYIDNQDKSDTKAHQACQIQSLCLALCDPSLSKQNQINTLESLIALIPQDRPFHADLIGLKAVMDHSIEISDNFEDLLLCGSEVDSCQRITGESHYNKCLLSYIMDGKNQLILIRNKKMQIKTRAIIRILLVRNAQTNDYHPVLFLEKTYGSYNKEIRLAIETAAKLRAFFLEIPFYTNTTSEASDILESLDSICPYEYVDSGGNQITNGTYHFRASRED